MNGAHLRLAATGLCAVLAALLLPAVVRAVEVPPALRTWLLAVDTAPTPHQLRSAAGRDQAGGAAGRAEDRAAALLEAVARDKGESQLVRNRALGLLSLLDGADAAKRSLALVRLEEPMLRATAALAWLAGPAHRQPQGSDGVVAQLLADPAPAVRAATARGLRYLTRTDRLRALAVARRRIESDAATRNALDAAIRQLDAPTIRR